jgi:hypothetical protein
LRTFAIAFHRISASIREGRGRTELSKKLFISAINEAGRCHCQAESINGGYFGASLTNRANYWSDRLELRRKLMTTDKYLPAHKKVKAAVRGQVEVLLQLSQPAKR